MNKECLQHMVTPTTLIHVGAGFADEIGNPPVVDYCKIVTEVQQGSQLYRTPNHR